MALPQVYSYIFSVLIKNIWHCFLSENNKEITVIKNVSPLLEYKINSIEWTCVENMDCGKTSANNQKRK